MTRTHLARGVVPTGMGLGRVCHRNQADTEFHGVRTELRRVFQGGRSMIASLAASDHLMRFVRRA
ncbi:hypothetical protein CCS01_20465 [Rhodopila globiformis]|uniref:Uncharacterized protein n=1 Tax=Rhodopila globiformis TaxID=1071 RepID=A0A2S6N5S7_RHOGL|nr:hypothetical protein CCS01_20465 [Rhodopila globiformis]